MRGKNFLYPVLWKGGNFLAQKHPKRSGYLLIRDENGSHFDVRPSEVQETTDEMTDELDAEIREDVRIMDEYWRSKTSIN